MKFIVRRPSNYEIHSYGGPGGTHNYEEIRRIKGYGPLVGPLVAAAPAVGAACESIPQRLLAKISRDSDRIVE